MSWQIIISALALGGISSFHCVGMCGAFAFSLPTNHLEKPKKLAGIFLYNSGRILVYALLGVVFGVAGQQLALAGFQKTFSIIAGVLVLLFVARPFVKPTPLRVAFLNQFNTAIQKQISTYLRRKTLRGVFLLGTANGLLPCGMVYMAITAALATGTLQGGLLFMIGFGLGTFPAMFLISWFGFVIGITARNAMRKLVPYVVALMAGLLIMRGLGDYLPDGLSQFIPRDIISCHP